jgi:lipoic acid synthetase
MKGYPVSVDEMEPQHLLDAAEILGLTYIVITSVTRDDLPDGGASQFVKTITLFHEKRKRAVIEVLIPDFLGSPEALEAVIKVGPQVINHNVETVPRLYPEVRPEADYIRSMRLLINVKKIAPNIMTKSGLMLGLGETKSEVIGVMRDLRKANCDLLTISQYLQPSPRNRSVVSFIPPDMFDEYEEIAKDLGFAGVASAPLVRSSYKALELYNKAKVKHFDSVIH